MGKVDLTRLLAAMGGAPGGDPAQAALLQQLLGAQGTQRDDVIDASELEPPAKPSKDELLAQLLAASGSSGNSPPPQLKKLKRAQRQMKQMMRELEVLRARNDEFAAACGACPDCFGEDPRCRECRGRGVPGAYVPHVESWVHYIQPSLYQLGLISESPPDGADSPHNATATNQE